MSSAARRRHDGAFYCFYTGVTLVDEACQSRDHRYLVFEHRTSDDEASVVVTCALVNRMKTDLTEEQFKAMVAELRSVAVHTELTRFRRGRLGSGGHSLLA